MSDQQQDAVRTARKEGRAPAPDEDLKPDDLREITKPSWKYVAKKTFREFTADKCPDLAASLTYYGILSLFPALLALVSLLGLFGQAQNTVMGLLDIVEGVAPGDTADTLRSTLEELVSSPAAGFALVAGVAGALWSASGYVGAFGRAMNRIYEIEEGRGFVKLRGTMLAVTALSILVVAVIAAMLVLSGAVAEAVGSAIGLGAATVTAWDIAKWPVALALAVALIAVLYYFTPNVRQPRFRWMSIGSALALVVSVLATAGFGFYVANFNNYNKTYGALGGVVVLLLWLWLLNMSLLFGAEVDAELERGRQLQAGIEAEEELQLPPKDTKALDRRQAKEEADLEAGRALRKHRGDPPEETQRE